MADTEQEHIVRQADSAFAEYQQMICRRTDRFFAWFMVVQWLASIGVAVWFSPCAWHRHPMPAEAHVWAALFLGGTITSFPVFLAFFMPGAATTRHVIAGAQMLMSALLIHLSGGRLETHFHLFGSLALMAFYRDWRVLLTASFIVVCDNVVRGVYWPQSIYGTSAATPWRALEHAGWVAFAVGFLILGIRRSIAEMREIALRQATLEVTKEHIEEQVLRRTAQLQETVEQLETFCHSVSHDLRAPLRAMQSFARILVHDYGKNLDEFGRGCAQRIASSAERMDALMADLLEYTRISRMAMRLNAVPVRDAVEEVLILLAEDIRAKDADVIVAAELPIVKAHRSTLIQVLLNLVSNGLKFVQPGKRPQLRIGAEFIGDRAHVWVEDNGIGIEAKNIPKLFSMFQRLNVPHEYPGTGIGLAIVRKAVERMGGSVSVQSEPGQGSRFSVELAAAPIEPSGSPETSADAEAPVLHFSL